MDNLHWLQTWYLSQCDGHWEHNFGIVIETLDNPGWRVKIELTDTSVSLADRPWEWNETSETDWYGYKIENGVFDGSGDPHKLNHLLEIFRSLVA
ncbi:MAG: immunity 53 family protein [Bacteroidetes bacterium]|nr:immunity 53 family protein [Bacteroidota bacterium]MBS1942015.1 immunity 53 family protein [Bacteroidota bacterium]